MLTEIETPTLAPRPTRTLGAIALVGACMSVLTLGFATTRYVVDWKNQRMGRTRVAQRLGVLGPPYFTRPFIEAVQRLELTLPEDAKVLVEVFDPKYLDSRSRWYLYLNYYLYPRQLYVRTPEYAGATLVEYADWLRLQFEPQTLTERLELLDRREELGLEWRLAYPITKRFLVDSMVLERWTDDGWEPVELAPLAEPLPPLIWRRAKPQSEADDDAGGLLGPAGMPEIELPLTPDSQMAPSADTSDSSAPSEDQR